MNEFERGKDPKESMDIGLTEKAAIVHALLYIDRAPSWEGSSAGTEILVRMNSFKIPEILQSIVEDPKKVLKYFVEFITKDGYISSGNQDYLKYFAGTYVQYKNKIYLIPRYE